MRHDRLLIAAALFSVGAFGTAWADSISPDSYSTTLGVGESATITKTVTISAGTPTSARLDVLFLVDTTGSMGGVIGQVQTSANAILSSLSAYGDVEFGVSAYKDEGDVYVYSEVTPLTGSAATVTTGLNSLFASGGGDTPEANLAALGRAATEVGWRDGSTRVLVWFGDAPGHDPRAGWTEATATAALLGESIIVHAVDSGFGGLDSTGQATRITDATGGDLWSVSSSSGVADAILDAVETTFDKYSSVSLGVEGDSSCVDVTTSPAAHTGAFDRSSSRDFTFDVTFTGATPGTCSFDITALVDGGVVAVESDRITVEGVAPIPLPAGLPLLVSALLGVGLISRRRR